MRSVAAVEMGVAMADKKGQHLAGWRLPSETMGNSIPLSLKKRTRPLCGRRIKCDGHLIGPMCEKTFFFFQFQNILEHRKKVLCCVADFRLR